MNTIQRYICSALPCSKTSGGVGLNSVGRATTCSATACGQAARRNRWRGMARCSASRAAREPQLRHEADLPLLLAFAHQHHAHFGARRLGQVRQVDVAAANFMVVEQLALVVDSHLRTQPALVHSLEVRQGQKPFNPSIIRAPATISQVLAAPHTEHTVCD